MSIQQGNGGQTLSGEEVMSEDEARKRREQLNRRPSYRMILKDLETADKVLKKEPEETPPSSVDTSPLQVNIPPSTIRSSVATGPSPYTSPLAGSLLQGGTIPHPLHLNGDLGALPPGLDFAAAIAAAASSSQNPALAVGAGSAGIPMNHDGPMIKPVTGMDPASFSGSRGSVGGCGGGEDESTRKRQVRLLKNREAAKECRRKKKEYVKCLESRVAVLENQNKALIEELKTLKELYCRKEKSDI